MLIACQISLLPTESYFLQVLKILFLMLKISDFAAAVRGIKEAPVLAELDIFWYVANNLWSTRVMYITMVHFTIWAFIRRKGTFQITLTW